MKKIVSALLLSGLFLAPVFAEKVAIVDLEKVKEGYGKATDSAKTLASSFEGAKAQLDSMVQKLKKLHDDAEATNRASEDPMLSEAARSQKKSEAKVKIEAFLKEQQAIRQFEQEAGASFRKRAEEVDREILKEVRDQTAVVAKKKSIDVVLPKGMVLFSGESIDISADVIKLLNESYGANPVNPGAPIVETKK